jgi:8-oxo-dGTP pyrophosphatase MutT (NUDIX family)
VSLDLKQIRRAFAGKLDESTRRQPAGRHAVVAAIVRQGDTGGEVLLIERADDERDPWSGHMALPGGRHDPVDTDLLATAQRETLEEIGLSLEANAELLGRLESVRAALVDRSFEICPLVFALERGEVPLFLNPLEVKKVIWASLAHLMSPAAVTNFEYRRRSSDVGEPRSLHFPAFDVAGHIVWGLTYRILNNLLDMARLDMPR